MAIKNELGFETLKKQLLEIERKNIKEIDKDESQPVIDTKSKEKKEKAKEIPIEGFNVPNKVLNKVDNKLVDCLEKCLICRHIRRFAD